ncbi:hypothetical protein HMPREF0216_02387 [Clostridium celatum DSM 1785]|uniref:Uncharacterized protein n=1 Tax=Clostridium celatum DSM 1785 TaxID=545697 RepID=L1QDS1_9CLOT|nr:hypothetical protein HMPREF0216_02387 [Clostridium celatum DSM 1785]
MKLLNKFIINKNYLKSLYNSIVILLNNRKITVKVKIHNNDI